MKYFTILTMILFISCNPKSDAELEVEETGKVSNEDINPHDFSGGNSGSQVVSGAQTLLAQTTESYKTFKELNLTYAKLTQVSPKRADAEYQQIITSLPADPHPDYINKFHALAASRLADVYCNIYINEGKLGLTMSSATPSQIADKMVENFLDEEKSGDLNYVREGLMPILRNDIIDPNDGTRFIDPDPNASSRNQKLSKLACTALFASFVVAGNAGERNYDI